MKNELHPRRPVDIFRIILLLVGMSLSIAIIITQFALVSPSMSLILISLGIAGVGAIISVVIARRTALRIGKEALAKIFISFSYSDKKFVDRLTNELAQKGFEILRADKAILVGDNFDEKLVYLLFRADFFIVVISNKSLQSQSVLNETIAFMRRERKVFPVLIEETEQSDYESENLPDALRGIQFANFIKDFNKGFQELLYALDENIANKSNNREGNSLQE